jgi:hypothetical protein
MRKNQFIDVVKLFKKPYQAQLVKSFLYKDLLSFVKKIKHLEKDIESQNIDLELAYKNLVCFSSEVFKSIRNLERNIKNQYLLKKLKEVFSYTVKESAIKSVITRRAYEKPLGYPGDYEIIEMFYNNVPLSKGIGLCGDRYILQDEYVEAVRNRKEIMKKLILNFIKVNHSKSLKIMNIGCGSSREIRELLVGQFFNKKITFTLIDWEKKALNFSRKKLSDYASKTNIFRFLRANVLTIYKHSLEAHLINNNQDLIYSIGLADYLPDIILGELIKFSFALLKKGGILIIAHKNIKVRKSLVPDWFCGWTFYPRAKKDMRRMVKIYLSNQRFTLKIEEEKTKHLYFLTIKKID